jgi:NADH-quinone oxidoreductase subunit L
LRFSAGFSTCPSTPVCPGGIASLIAVAGLLLAHFLYAGGRWRSRTRPLVTPEISGFFREGWYVDRLYGLLFVRPYRNIAGFLWRRIDESALDGSIDAMSDLTGTLGQRLGRWSDGRISLYLASFAAGAAIIAAYFAWVIF